MKSRAATDDGESLKHARAALRLMGERGVEPTPVNYAVWYHYVAGDLKELAAEIDHILSTKTLAVSDDVNVYLYNKYVHPVPAPEGEDAGRSAQALLAQIMEVMERFGGDTATYNRELDEHVTALSSRITDPALKEMAREIVSRAVAIRHSGAALGEKLEESRREVVELKSTLEKVTSESTRDFLTGAANRRTLEAKLEEMTAAAKEKGSDLCLLMIDIDHFKTFNDRFGHPIGDEVLRKVGKALFDSVKGKDVVARYGGEEFAVLLPQTPLAGGLAVGEGIRRAIAETELVRKDTGESLGGVTVSLGVARFRRESDSVALLMSRADDALYRSKMGGRNRVTPESF